MMQINSVPLSESLKDQLQAWLADPAAEIFLKIIRAEQARLVKEASSRQMSMNRNAVAGATAHFMFVEADAMERIIETFKAMRTADYKFETVTITP